VGQQGKKTLGAVAAFAVYGTAAIALASSVRHVAVSVTDLEVEYGCGPTPQPTPMGGGPTPGYNCPPVAKMTVTYQGSGCTAEDFYIRVKQSPTDQLVTIFKLRSAKECDVVSQPGSSSPTESVLLQSPLIDPFKPVRVTNRIPVQAIPRP
jgi:hypothetical protein